MIPIEYLETGEYLVKGGQAYYKISPDFHTCTYSLIVAGRDPNRRSHHWLSREEIEETAREGGYHIQNIRY